MLKELQGKGAVQNSGLSLLMKEGKSIANEEINNFIYSINNKLNFYIRGCFLPFRDGLIIPISHVYSVIGQPVYTERVIEKADFGCKRAGFSAWQEEIFNSCPNSYAGIHDRYLCYFLFNQPTPFYNRADIHCA